MRSAAEALLWKNWQLTRVPLLLQQLGVIAVVSLLFIVVFPQDADASRQVDFGIHVLVLMSLCFLVSPLAMLSKSNSRNRLTGFPYHQEYVLPISTATLVLVPVVYFSLLFVFAYIFPLLVLSALFDVTGPQFLFVVLVFESVLTVLALAWWTSSGLARSLGWIVLMLLYWNQTRFLSFGIADGTHIVVLESLSQLIVPTLITATLLALMYLGVIRQRYGDDLFGIEREDSTSSGRFLLRNLFPLAPASCPTDSAVAAEIWKERQLRGLASADFIAVLAAFTALLIIRLLSVYRAFDGGLPELEEVVVILFLFYLLFVMGAASQTFGVSVRNGTPHFSVFDRTLPLGTAKLVAIKFSITIAGLMLAAMAMASVVWVFGSLFIDGFEQIKVLVVDKLVEFTSVPALALIRLVVLSLVAFTTATILWSAFCVWTLLKPKLMAWAWSILLVYGFLLFMFIAWITEENEFNTLSTAINIKHLWLFMFGLPAVLVYLCRGVVRDRIVNARQLLLLSTMGLLFALLYVSYLIGTEFYATESHIEVLVSTSLLGVLPLAAILFALRTMGSLRHH